MKAKGMTQPQLARAARVSPRSLRRWLGGENASESGAEGLARALGVNAETLLVRQDVEKPFPPTPFVFQMELAGILSNQEQLALLHSVTPQIIATLSRMGVELTAIKGGTIAVSAPRHTIVLLTGKNTGGVMIWCYLKIAFESLPSLEHALTLDAPFNPSQYGDVISASKGEVPDDVREEIRLRWDELTK